MMAVVLTFKPRRRVDLHKLVTEATRREGEAPGWTAPVNIAQASSIGKHVLDLLAAEWRKNPRGLVKMLEARS